MAADTIAEQIDGLQALHDSDAVQMMCLQSMINALADGKTAFHNLPGCPVATCAEYTSTDPRLTSTCTGVEIGSVCTIGCPDSLVPIGDVGGKTQEILQPTCMASGGWSDGMMTTCGESPPSTTRDKQWAAGKACDHTVDGDNLHNDCVRCNQHYDGREQPSDRASCVFVKGECGVCLLGGGGSSVTCARGRPVHVLPEVVGVGTAVQLYR